jgi:pathogenesis-related protein 1
MSFRSFVTVALVFWVVSAASAGTQKRPAAETQTGVKSSAMSPAHIREITGYHNKVRHDVGVGPLKWSSSLAAFAQQWADELAASSCRMKHRRGHKFGENLFIGTAGHYRAVHAAKAWEGERPLYTGGVLTRANWKPAGHYTQMVWRNTARLGCGESQCKGMLMVVCNYDPPGNYIGEKPY